MNTVLRAIFTAFLALFLVGFGLCGAYGTFGGVFNMFPVSGQGKGFAVLLLVCGLSGLGIAWLCWKAIASLWRKPGPPA